MWLGHSVNIGCDVATPEQALMGDQLWCVGREEALAVEDTDMQLHRQIPEQQCDVSSLSVASQVASKTPKFSIFSGHSTKKGVLFEQQTFEVRSKMQSHSSDTEGRKSIVTMQRFS